MLSWIITNNYFEFLPIIFFFLLLTIYIYLTKKIELFWFVIYYFIFFYILICVLFLYSDIILIYFLDEVLEPLVVSDPTHFAYNYFYFMFNLSILLSIPFFSFLVWIFMSNYSYKFNNYFNISLIFLFNLSLLIIFWIIKFDLFFSNWLSLTNIPQFSITFDLQPNFDKFFNSFWFEYKEFTLTYFILIFIPFYIILCDKWNKYFKINQLFYFLLILNIFFIFYFFFEFVLWNNILLCFIIYILQLCFQFIIYILYASQRYKNLS